MSPELSILKRKRSRPSEWWAAPLTSNATEAPPQQDEFPPKKRGRSSISGVDRVIQEAPTAGNRGKIQSSIDQEDTGNAEDGGEVVAKPLRRGRSSNTEAEVVAVADLAAETEDINKKKRGSLAQKVEEDDGTVTKAVRRGRTSNTEAKSKAAAEATIKNNAASQEKRRRSRKQREVVIKPFAKPLRRGQSSETHADRGPAQFRKDAAPKKKLGRSIAMDVEEDEVGNEPVEVATALRKRDRPSISKERDELADEAETQATPKKHAMLNEKRTRTPDVDDEELVIYASMGIDGVKRTSRGRRSGTVIEIETATSSLARDRQLRKKVDSNSEATKIAVGKGSSAAQEPLRSKGRVHLPKANIQGSKDSHYRREKSKHSAKAETKRTRRQLEEIIEERPKSKRSRMERQSQQETAPQTEKPPAYQHMAAVTRHVSRQTIEDKWESLPPGCVEKISQLLQDLQRPIVVPLNDERKRTDASKVMQMVSRRLISKISKGLPFPLGTSNFREDDFDFEKILDHTKARESQLTPALHSNKLLESEIAKEKALLESEEAVLAGLETNAKTEATVRKDAGRRLHSLLLSSDLKIEGDRLYDHIGLGEDDSILSLTHTEDEDLQDIAKELHGHLDSIQSNIGRVDGISSAMAKSRAAVQAILFDHLDTSQFEDVVLG